jgi:hypothetical protein
MTLTLFYGILLMITLVSMSIVSFVHREELFPKWFSKKHAATQVK